MQMVKKQNCVAVANYKNEFTANTSYIVNLSVFCN